MHIIKSREFSDLMCSFKKEDLDKGLKELSEIFEVEIERFGVWVSFNGGSSYVSEERKYADYYPLFGLFIKQPDAGSNGFIPVRGIISDSTLDKLCSDNWTDFFNACGDAIYEESNVKTVIEELLVNENLKKFINNEILPFLPPYTKVCSFSENEQLVKYCYDVLTSAAYHLFWGRLAVQQDGKQHTFPSYLRQSQLGHLIGRDIPRGLKENFAVDYGNVILYLHMDDTHGGYDNPHFNRYLYNQGVDEMSFVDGINDNTPIPYSEWTYRLNKKPVLIFGYDEQKRKALDFIPKYPLYKREPILKFLGCHEGIVETDEVGNCKLSLRNTYNFQE